MQVAGFKVGHSIREGDRALVTIIADKLCAVAEQKCVSNHDPNSDLPTTSSGFDKAFKTAAKGGDSNAFPCIRIGGKWYVQI